MEKSDKKRILTRVLIVIAALTLLSCCFLGSTFARYVTSAGGSGTVGVAKWDIDISVNGSEASTTTFTFGQLSPSISGSTNTITATDTTALKIENKGEVSALVKVDTNGLTLTPNYKEGVDSSAGSANKERFADVFSATVTPLENFGSNYTGNATTGYVLPAEVGCILLSVQVTWTTIDDEVDTWYGEWLENIKVSLSLSAIQNSQIPA